MVWWDFDYEPLGARTYNTEFLQEIYSFRWPYLSQYSTYSIGFQHLDIIFDALSENEEKIEKF